MANLRLISKENDPTDRELIEQTIAGDEGAYAILVGRYQRRIYRVAYAVVRDEAEADAITQDTFVAAYMKLSRFEGRSELETWLTRIAINKSRDHLRGRKRRFLPIGPHDDEEDGPGIDPADERPDAERLLMSSQVSVAIDTAVESLSAQQKTIFRLRHYEELPLEDIARLLNLAPGTVRAHLFRAIHKVRKELESWAGPPAVVEEPS